MHGQVQEMGLDFEEPPPLDLDMGMPAMIPFTVTFEDGTIKDAFLSWKAFRQLLNLKTGQANLTGAKPAANGTVEKTR